MDTQFSIKPALERVPHSAISGRYRSNATLLVGEGKCVENSYIWLSCHGQTFNEWLCHRSTDTAFRTAFPGASEGESYLFKSDCGAQRMHVARTNMLLATNSSSKEEDTVVFTVEIVESVIEFFI